MIPRVFKESKITSKIEQIVNLEVIHDWKPVNELCNDVNAQDGGAKEAAKALRKRMHTGTPQQQLNVITIIQSMMDRCGSKFKAELATTKFANELMETIWSDLTNAHVRARLIERLGDWAKKCGNDPGLAIIPSLHHKVLSDRYLTQRFMKTATPLIVAPLLTKEQRALQILSDVDLADNNARMLQEAVAFADPELEAVEENELVKEFYSKCVTLHRSMQVYLAEVTESSEPNEICLAGILSANDELAMALRSHRQMMERRKAIRAQMRAITPGAGVNNNNSLPATPRAGSPTSTHGEATQAFTEEVSAVATAPEPANPFADEPYFVSGPTDVAAVIRSGKQRDQSMREDDDGELSAKEREQLLRMLRDDSMVGSSSSGAARAGSSTPTPMAVV